MAVILNRAAYAQAEALIKNLDCVPDERGDWSLHRPTRGMEKRFIAQHGMAEYAKWHLGEDDDIEEHSLRRYKYPYGDFKKLHRCAVLAAESRAGQYKHTDIELAAAHLHGMLEELMHRGMPKYRTGVASA